MILRLWDEGRSPDFTHLNPAWAVGPLWKERELSPHRSRHDNLSGYNSRTQQIAPMNKPTKTNSLIAENRKARFEYFIEDQYEAGLALQGWEVKAIRAGRAQLKEAYVYLRGGEAFLIGAHISPLPTTSTHVIADPVRTRKLLLHRNELQHLIGSVERRGYTLVPLEMYWKNGRAKLRIGLAKGKKQHDKRATEKERDWQRDKARLLRRA